MQPPPTSPALTLPLTLRPDRGRVLRTTCLVFLPIIAAALWLGSIRHGLTAGFFYVSAVFLVLMAALLLRSAFGGPATLEVTANGFTVGGLVGLTKVPWADVAEFGFGSINGKGLLLWRYRPGRAAAHAPGALGRLFQVRVSGWEGSTHLGLLPVDPAALATFMQGLIDQRTGEGAASVSGNNG